MSNSNEIAFQYLSQEDLLQTGCLDFHMAIGAVESALLANRSGTIIFPDKIVQIFDEETQERINCLPATLRDEGVCGLKWVSVSPPNTKHGLQNQSAMFILSEIEHGFPIAVMEGTLCSNMRVGAVGAMAAKYLAPENAEVIGFIGAGEQAKMHLLAMKTVRPSLTHCNVAAATQPEEQAFVDEMSRILPAMTFAIANTDGQRAMADADILVTATSAQAPLLKAAWMKPGSFYSHIGGWEDEFGVAEQCQKIVCDDWDTVKHRTQTLSRMYQAGALKDTDIHANLDQIVAGERPGREGDDERIYFNAVGLAFVDIAIAVEMYRRATEKHAGERLTLQQSMIFEHPKIADWVDVY